MYHGTPAERAELRRTVLAPPSRPEPKKTRKENVRPQTKRKIKPSPPSKTSAIRGTRRRPRVVNVAAEDEDTEGAEEDAEQEVDTMDDSLDVEEDEMAHFPIVITTYEMIIKDRAHLANYEWGYIVVDEGHRLKNLNCKLIKEIKKYTSAGRMLLTGTPLHVRLPLLFAWPAIAHDSHSTIIE